MMGQRFTNSVISFRAWECSCPLATFHSFTGSPDRYKTNLLPALRVQ
jgi:hypothetical protein